MHVSVGSGQQMTEVLRSYSTSRPVCRMVELRDRLFPREVKNKTNGSCTLYSMWHFMERVGAGCATPTVRFRTLIFVTVKSVFCFRHKARILTALLAVKSHRSSPSVFSETSELQPSLHFGPL
jgi:hypothetical protein